MQVKTEPTKLRLLRDRYNLTQEALARAANLPISTYRSAEYGNNVEYTTATKILKALNEVSEMTLELEDLGLSIV